MLTQFHQLIGSEPSKLFSNLLLSLIFVLVFVGFGLLVLYLTLWMLTGTETLIISSERMIKKEIIFGKALTQKTVTLSSLLRVELSNTDHNAALKLFTTDGDQILLFGSGLKREQLQALQQEIERFRSKFF
jgi:hypothetical protein